MGIFNIFKTPSAALEPIIRVEFINGADNSVIGVSNIPCKQLPDTFAINTNLDIKDQKWSVQSADPVDKAQFIKTGNLRLVLSRLSMVNPAEVLFSLPTISDDVGNVRGTTLPNEAIFAIHEDDWRQVEFISATFNPEIHQEFVDIQHVCNSEKSGPAFKKLHVRKRIPNPLAVSSLNLDGLKVIIPSQKRYDGVGFYKTPGTIPQSFAWNCGQQLVLWGIAKDDGKILRLCLSGLPARGEVPAISTALANLTERYQLSFVDWCRTTEIHSDAKGFETYFQQQR